ncbi:hypothetical protein [Kitasatospora purpeofusca]
MDYEQLAEVIETTLTTIEDEVGIAEMEIPDLAASIAAAVVRAQS